MKREQELNVQSYVDGELPEREVRRLRDWLSENAQAQRLLAELDWTRTALSENEPELSVPESREFYWGKIERAIQREEQAQPRQGPSLVEWALGLRRFFVPAAGMALLALLVLGLVNFYDVAKSDPYPDHLAQIESPSEEIGAFSFRSQAENVFVVWLYDRPTQASLNRDLLNHMVIQ